jgi:PKD repeat protein
VSGNPRRKVTFTDQSTYAVGCPIQTWLWEFGDGSPNSNAINPVHTFPNNNGTYVVRLTVTNSAGSDDVVVTVAL